MKVFYSIFLTSLIATAQCGFGPKRHQKSIEKPGMGMGMEDGMGMGMGSPVCVGPRCCRPDQTPNAVLNDLNPFNDHGNSFTVKSCDGSVVWATVSPASSSPLCLPSHSFRVVASGGQSLPFVAFEVEDLTQQGFNYSAVQFSISPYTALSRSCINCAAGMQSTPFALAFNEGEVNSISILTCAGAPLFTISLANYIGVPPPVFPEQKQGEDTDTDTDEEIFFGHYDLKNYCLPQAGFIAVSDTYAEFGVTVHDWNAGAIAYGLSSGGYFNAGCD